MTLAQIKKMHKLKYYLRDARKKKRKLVRRKQNQHKIHNYKAVTDRSILITSYNPQAKQTDSTPCIAGGTGYNLCHMSKTGVRPIAFSQDMVQWAQKEFKAPLEKGDIVYLKSTDFPKDGRCNGEFIVSDTMNIRFRERGDIFFSDKKDNLSCHAVVYKTRKKYLGNEVAQK